MQQLLIVDRNDLRSMLEEIAENLKKSDKTKERASKKETAKRKVYLTRREISKMLNISLVTLGKRQREGLPSIVIGKRRLYDLEAVERYIESIQTSNNKK
jgi:hypothetical protein